MNLLKIIKNNLFIQNFVASLFSFIPPYLEFTLAKYQAIKKAMYITAHDLTDGNYLEFGIFTGSSFNFAMKINIKIEKIFGKTNCEFIGFDSFKGFGKINEDDKNPRFEDHIFSVDEKKIKCPVLVVGAAKDKVTPINIARAVAVKICHVSDYIEYSEFGHWLMSGDEFSVVSSDCLKWIKEKLNEH